MLWAAYMDISVAAFNIRLGLVRRWGQGGSRAAAPADFPQVLDFRSPDHIQQLVVYEPSDATGPQQQIYGHPGAPYTLNSAPACLISVDHH